MKRTKIDDRVLPTYSRGEEIFNMVSHIVGGGIGVISLVLLIILSAIKHNTYAVVSCTIFSVTMIILYTMSSIYHGLRPSRAKKVLQIFDHCAIYLLIAGSYTPFCLCTLREYDPAIGWSLFGIVWFFAIIGITFDAIDLKSFRVLSKICYLGMGWAIIFKINILPELLTVPGFILLLAGGIIYTIGAILYGVGVKVKWMHSIFHLCIVVANILHLICIALYVI